MKYDDNPKPQMPLPLLADVKNNGTPPSTRSQKPNSGLKDKNIDINDFRKVMKGVSDYAKKLNW